MTAAQVIYEDAGTRRLGAFLEALRTAKIQIGYQPPEGRARYSSGISVAKLAAVHEFGGDELAARPFIRPTIERYRSAIAALAFEGIQARLERVVEGKLDPERAAVQVGTAVGVFVVQRIRDRLESAESWAAPLDPETIARKDSGDILEETGLLIQSLSWRVSRGSTELARGTA